MAAGRKGHCPACGGFLFRNQDARKTGIFAKHHPPDLRMTAADLIAGIVVDLGGESDLTTLQKAYVRKIADLEIVMLHLMGRVARDGLLTPSGRVTALHGALLKTVDRWDKLAMRIGLERRQRAVVDLARAFQESRR